MSHSNIKCTESIIKKYIPYIFIERFIFGKRQFKLLILELFSALLQKIMNIFCIFILQCIRTVLSVLIKELIIELKIAFLEA